MREQKTDIVIFSVYQNNLAEGSNKLNHLGVEALIAQRGWSYKVVKGKYNGRNEESFVMPYIFLNQIKDIALSYNQESILIKKTDSKAELLYLNTGATEEIGDMVIVSKYEALASNNYTYDITYDTYYICK